VDVHGLWAAAGIWTVWFLSRIFGGFFRRETLCDEGRLFAHGCVHAAALLPKLVPTSLSLYLQ